MPGFFLDHSISSGKLSRARPQTGVVTDVTIYVAFALPVHLTTIFVLERLGFFRSAVINYRLFLGALTGDFTSQQASLDRLAYTMLNDRWRIAGYLLATIVVALALGWLVQYALLRTPLKKMVPLQNPWFNTFFLPNWEPIGQCRACVLIKSLAPGEATLYQGAVSDFRSDSAGGLAEIRLRKVQRSSLPSGSFPTLWLN